MFSSMACCGNAEKYEGDMESITYQDSRKYTATKKPGVQRAFHHRLALRLGMCLGIVVVLLFALYVIVKAVLLDVLTTKAIDQMLTIKNSTAECGKDLNLNAQNMTSHIWWPNCGWANGNISYINDECALPCYPGSLVKEIDDYNKKHPWTKVFFKSRKADGMETLTLGGWWMPAPGANKTTPRVVIQHGFTMDPNSVRIQVAAYMMRSLGFSVLLSSFRDVCYSENSTAHIYNWGYAYPFDLLGGWDYAKNDPDGILGGKLSADKVGIMGFSKGAFTTLNSFGLEASLPAVWVDSPPFIPDTVFTHGGYKELEKLGLPRVVGDVLMPEVWTNVEKEAALKGIDIDMHVPETELPKGPNTSRPIYVVANKEDDTVPLTEHHNVMALLAKLPSKYDVKGHKQYTGTCHGDAHCWDHLREFDDYLARLCHFWRPVFGQSVKACGKLEDDIDIENLLFVQPGPRVPSKGRQGATVD